MRIGIAALTVIARSHAGARSLWAAARVRRRIHPAHRYTYSSCSFEPAHRCADSSPSLPSQPPVAPTPTTPSAQPTAAPTLAASSAQSTVTPTPTTPSARPTATPTLAAPSAQPTAVPTQTTRPDDQARVRVPVKSVDIQSVSIVVSGGAAEIVLEHGLPDGCHEFGGYGVDESSMPRIVIEIFNTRQAATGVVACAEIYLIEETRIPLEAGVEPCGTYVVEINGEGRRVQAMEPGKRCGAAQDANPTPVSPSPTAEPGLTRVQVPAYVESARHRGQRRVRRARHCHRPAQRLLRVRRLRARRVIHAQDSARSLQHEIHQRSVRPGVRLHRDPHTTGADHRAVQGIHRRDQRRRAPDAGSGAGKAVQFRAGREARLDAAGVHSGTVCIEVRRLAATMPARTPGSGGGRTR